MTAAPLSVPTRVAMLWVEGPDAATFLHGLLSQDVTGMAPGDTRPALLLDERGRIQADMRVVRDAADAFTLLLDPARAGDVAATFARLHFSEDLDVLGPDEVAAVVVDDRDRVTGADTVVPGVVPGTWEAVGDAVTVVGAPADTGPGGWDALRVAAGVPLVGTDTGPRSLVQEVGLEDSHVSFTKGCYLGQETVSRAQHRGGVRKVLRAVVGDAPLQVGAAATRDGAEVGTVTSVADVPGHGSVGLAVVRTAAEPGARVRVGGVGATVREVPLSPA